MVYSRDQWIKAVKLSALMGWAIVIAPPAIVTLNPALIISGAIIGLPIAYLICWVVVAPILKRLMRGEISWATAAAWGASISSFLAFLTIAFGRYNGWRQSVDPHSFSQIGGGDFIRSVDGILTTYGWILLALQTVLFVVAGTVAALFVKWKVGAPAGGARDHDA